MARSATANARNDSRERLSGKTRTVCSRAAPSSMLPRRSTSSCSHSKEPGNNRTARLLSGCVCCTVSASAPALEISIRRTLKGWQAAAAQRVDAAPHAAASSHGHAKLRPLSRMKRAEPACASAASSNSARRRQDPWTMAASAIDGGKGASGTSRMASERKGKRWGNRNGRGSLCRTLCTN